MNQRIHTIGCEITGKMPDKAKAEHRSIENSCRYIIDWNYDEDRSRISKGYGPAHMTRLRKFSVGLLKSKGVNNVAQRMRQLSFPTRMVLDYLELTSNTQRVSGLKS